MEQQYQQEQRTLYLQQLEIKRRIEQITQQREKEEQIRKDNLRKYLWKLSNHFTIWGGFIAKFLTIFLWESLIQLFK